MSFYVKFQAATQQNAERRILVAHILLLCIIRVNMRRTDTRQRDLGSNVHNHANQIHEEHDKLMCADTLLRRQSPLNGMAKVIPMDQEARHLQASNHLTVFIQARWYLCVYHQGITTLTLGSIQNSTNNQKK